MKGDHAAVPRQALPDRLAQNPFAGAVHHLDLVDTVQQRIIEKTFELRQCRIDPLANQ